MGGQETSLSVFGLRISFFVKPMTRASDECFFPPLRLVLALLLDSGVSRTGRRKMKAVLKSLAFFFLESLCANRDVF